MNRKISSTILYPIFGSLIGMILGFTIFLITENIIFLILSFTTGMTLWMAIGQQKEKENTSK